jgi:hypothetical protein
MTNLWQQVSSQRHAPVAFHPRGKDPGTHRTGGWVGLTAGVGIEARGKKSIASAGDRTSIARSSSPSPDAILTELPQRKH